MSKLQAVKLKGGTMSLQEVIKRDSDYYITTAETIKHMGYKDPSRDLGDPRQRASWEVLEDGGYTLEIVASYDCANVGSHESEYFQYFQTRADGEGNTEHYYEQFYTFDKKPERILFGMKIKGEVFFTCGNRRIRGHQKGIEAGYPSKCDIVLIDRPGMTDDDKCDLAHRLARISNRQDDSVRDETENDYIYQLTTAFSLHCKRVAAATNWSDD